MLRAVPCAVTVQATFGRSCEHTLVARWRGGGWRESRRPLMVLDIGSEKRRNVGQLCHPFEVRTACLWSGGWALGFHVLLSCDLGRPQLHKPYWKYHLEKNNNTLTQSIPALMGLENLMLYEAERDEWESAGSFKASLWQNLVTEKHVSQVLTHYLSNKYGV